MCFTRGTFGAWAQNTSQLVILCLKVNIKKVWFTGPITCLLRIVRTLAESLATWRIQQTNKQTHTHKHTHKQKTNTQTLSCQYGAKGRVIRLQVQGYLVFPLGKIYQKKSVTKRTYLLRVSVFHMQPAVAVHFASDDPIGPTVQLRNIIQRTTPQPI